MDINRIKIKVSDVFSNLGICEDPQVKFEIENSGYLVPCEGKDYIEIVPLIDFEGLAVWIKCSECDICGWKKVVIKPCDTDLDCPDCSKCKEDGYCVFLCKDDEFCKDKKCVECDETHLCANGKICIDGECTCPPNKPIWNGKECVACVTDEECGKCHKCTSEGCKPKDCICDPKTGDCVECMNSGDCKALDPNKCCNPNTHKCECCPGYVWSYEENKCVKGPKCYEDKDCLDPCKYCDHGDCKPIRCPAGQTCYLGDCVTICDCAKGGCPEGFTCMPYGAICICVLCEGNCDTDNDCKNGCKCGKLKKCIPNPCTGTCRNGTECANGCGCDKNGDCVLCADKDCEGTQCEEIDGCKCNDNNCEDSDNECHGECTSFMDCKGVNCTCWKGKCVSCSNFPCDGQCEDVPGCGCDRNGDCAGTSKNCTDTFTFTKDGCGAKIELTLKEKCSCKELIFKSKFNPVYQSLPPDNQSQIQKMFGIYVLEIKKNVNGQPLLSDVDHEGISHNDLPLSGLIELNTRYYLELKETGVENGYVDLLPIKIDLSNKATVEYDFNVLALYENYDTDNIVTRVETYVKLAEDLTLPNGCVYKKGLVLFTLNCNEQSCNYKTGSTEMVYLGSTNFTDPLIKVYRTRDDIYRLPYRKIYKIPVSLGKYVDRLYGSASFALDKQILVPDEGLLFGNQTYIAKNDCACEGYASLGKVINCEPAALNYTLAQCNAKITLTGFTPQCSTNKDLAYYGADNYDKLYSQASWKLFIDGVNVATFKYVGDPVGGEVKEITSGESITGYTYTKWDNGALIPIGLVELKMYYGEVMVCSLSDSPSNSVPIPTHSTECPNVTSNVYYDNIDKVSNGMTVMSVSAKDVNGNSVYVQDIGTQFKVHAPFGIETVVRVQYADGMGNAGCMKEYTIKESCCGTFSVSATADYADNQGCGGDVTLLATVIGGARSVTYEWTTPGGSKLAGQNITLSDYDNGTYQVEATDANGCVSMATVDVNVLNIEFDLPEDRSVCNGSIAQIQVTGTTGAQLEYRIGTGNLQTVTLPGTITTPALTATINISFTQITYGACTNILNEVTILNVVTNAQASITEIDTQQCVGATPSVAIDGTPSAIVEYKINNVTGQVQIENDGTKEIPLPNTSGSYYVQLTKATLGSCVQNITGQQITVLVQNSPIINIINTSYECSSSGGGSFVYLFRFEVSNYTGTPVASIGTVELVSGNIYRVINIPSGQSTIITASNGTSCVSTQESQIYNCNCNSITIPPPIPVQSVYTFCDGGVVPTLEVELAITCTCRVDWYDANIAGTLLASNSLTYTPSDPGTGLSAFYYAEAVDLISGCKSNRVAVAVENSELPNSVFVANAANKYCFGNTVYFSVPYQAQVTYLWSVINGTIQGSATGTSVTVLLDTIDILSVRLTTTNIDGCADATTETYTIGNLTYTIDAYDCLLNKAVLHLGGIVGHTYQAIFTNTTTGFIKTVNGLAGGGTHNITSLTDGDYTVSVKDENNAGCTTTDTYTVACCALSFGATAVLNEEGCWTIANGGDIDIDVECTFEVYSDYKMYREFYINGVKVKNQVDSSNGLNSCATVTVGINSTDLNLHPNVLIASGNILGVKFKKNNSSGDIVFQDASVLTFDAGDCLIP